MRYIAFFLALCKQKLQVMQTKITLLVFFCCIVAPFQYLRAQEAEEDTTRLWTYTGAGSLGFSNVVLSNWAGGGENSISLSTLLDFKATRQTDQSKWANYFNFNFGIARVGGDENLFKKTNDQIILGTAYDYNLAKNWSATAGLEVRTQIAPGYTFARDSSGNEIEDQLISEFFAPGYLYTNLGITYKNKLLSVTLSPASNKLTFVLNDSLSEAGAFGVDPGDKVRSEVGATLNGVFEFSPIENITFKTTLLLFSNYANNPQNIDVDWTTLLVFKVNKFFDASFGTRLIYDDDILIEQEDGTSKQAVQYSQVLSINVGYKF